MILSGQVFLSLLRGSLGSLPSVTEAHPKVLYYALTGRKAEWRVRRTPMALWLVDELGLGEPDFLLGPHDHTFDATLAALAALRGLNREWTLDLHDSPDSPDNPRVRPFGRTHYWWPDDGLSDRDSEVLKEWLDA